MRNLSAQALTTIATKLGNEPVTIVEIDWVDDDIPTLYADRDIGSIKGKILEVGSLDNVINVTNSDSSQELSLTLDDTNGTIKAIIDANDIHKRSARVYQWFEGMDLADRFLLFAGKISSPVTWSERDRSIAFTIISQIEDKEIGFSAEEGDFPWVPADLIGRSWPMIFGKVQDVPAMQFNKAVSGTILCGVGIISGAQFHKAMPLGGDNGSLGSGLAMMTAQLNHLTRVRSAYLSAYGSRSYTDYQIKANQILNQQNSIRAQMSEAASNKNEQTACVTQQRSDLVENQGLGCNPVRVLGGEDFQQNIGLRININGGIFAGHFEGDLFYISDRIHEDNEIAAEKAYNAGIKSHECAPSAPPRTEWDFSTNVPEGTGDSIVSTGGGSGIAFNPARDIVDDHGWSITTIAPTSRPSATQVARHFWAEAGSRVVMYSDEEITYVVSIIPGTVLAVKAYKKFDNSERKLANVPDDLWSVETKNYGPITAVQVVLSKPLSTIIDQGWEDDLYVTFESDVGPHTCDILEYIIDNYTDLAYDTTTFTNIRTRLDPFPMNFPILDRKNTLEVLQEIAFQARCALWLSNGTFYIKYLPEEPSSDDTITVSDIDAENGVSVELTPTEDLVTKMIVSWRISWAEDDPNKIILRHNVKKYGTQQEDFDFYCYNQPDIVLKVATFWLIRKSNTWKKMSFKTYLQKLNLEPFDTVTLDFATQKYVADVAVKAIVEEATYNSDDNSIDFVCLTPVKSGTMEKYKFFWPSQVSVDWTFPTEDEEADGFAGGDGIGQNATGELPIGFTDLEDWGSGVVWVGGPNVVFGPHSDWGDNTPSDVGFTAQNVISPET